VPVFGHKGRWIRMPQRTERMKSAAWLLAAAALAVSPCAAQAPQALNGAAATVISLIGQVSVLRDNYPQVLNIGDAVQPQQIIVTGPDGFVTFRLADGSHFEVFPNSRAIFRKNQENWRDLLDVLIGRVKVYIQKLGDQPNPHRLFTPTAVISVRGTVFDVAVEDQDDTTLVSVEEGVVVVRHLLKPGREQAVHAGEWLRVYKNQPLTARSVDRGSVVQGALRAAAQALYDLMYRTSRGSGGSGTVPVPAGGGSSGDKDKGEAPTPPPPPPPPPPPAK